MKPSLSVFTDINIHRFKFVDEVPRWIVPAPLATQTTLPNPMRFMLSVAFLLSILAATASQTAIVVTRAPTQILIGADSKGTNPVTKASSSVCKIFQSDRTFFACAGILEDNETGFNVPAIAREALTKPGSFKQRVALFEQLMLKRLPSALKQVRKDLPDWYARQCADRDCVSVAFGMFEGGIPMVHSSAFIPTDLKDGNIKITPRTGQCPGAKCPDGNAVLYLGEQRAINAMKHAAQTNREMAALPPPDAVKKLLEIAIAEAPDVVGPPIGILVIERYGGHWYKQKPDLCAEIQAIPSTKKPSPSRKPR